MFLGTMVGGHDWWSGGTEESSRGLAGVVVS